ncbi:MAG: enoyl-CoA hydratase-related protein, partial [Alphaproteobacteria bacterium]
MIDFRTSPDQYRHWALDVDGQVATLTLDVAEDGGLVPGYELKLNSYDLSVDIELYDAVQRLRFEHPNVRAVLVVSGKDRVFCAGANIAMLGQSSHAAKVNFCKFTNETRLGIEDASAHSNQTYISVINGTAAGGGYELALATDYIILVDDGSSAVSLPEAPLLAVLPGTGGLTRVVDKRRVRRDRADFFCTVTEGVRGKRALDWKLVDELAPRSGLMAAAHTYANALCDGATETGVALAPLERTITETGVSYGTLDVVFDRDGGLVNITVRGPREDPPQN